MLNDMMIVKDEFRSMKSEVAMVSCRDQEKFSARMSDLQTEIEPMTNQIGNKICQPLN